MDSNVPETLNLQPGVTVTPEGTGFCVWAPNAEALSVVGTFNNWEAGKHPLEKNESGHWRGFFSDIKTGDEYKFQLKTAAGDLLRNDPRARQMTNSAGNSVVYDPNAFDWQDDAFRLPDWNKLVIYELHVGTFHVKEKGRPGDFDSLAEKLPYLQKLGVNVIEIMPPFEFPGDFSWGYNPAYPYAIESVYGGPDAFKNLVKEAHKHGIGVILDCVYNHFGPTDMDLWQFDGWSENDMGGIYFYNDWKAKTPWGDTRPDYGREEVRRYIHDNAMMWLEEYRVDGLRMDMIPYIRNVNADENPATTLDDGLDMLRWINGEISEKFPWKLTIAEDLHGLDVITNRTDYHHGLGFGSQWDADFVHPVRAVLTERDDANRDMDAVANAIRRQYSDHPYCRTIYTESHDEVANGQARVAEEVAENSVNNFFSKKLSSLGIALVLTAPGIPMLFQGHELLEDKWFSDTDPIDWRREKKFNGFVKLHRDLIASRRNMSGFTEGLSGLNTQVIRLDHEKKVIAFQRWANGGPRDTTVVVLNFSNEVYEDYRFGFPAEGVWKTRFNSDWKGYDDEFADILDGEVHADAGEWDGQPASAALQIAPYTAIILSQD
ncbi:MAG: alpha amylase C-terminal domain-containing protein [Mucilaginibacter polytrichastri]|nr:alpha amylase C-terminal domain-containing protein [Mucilaginibacter polytrichastri]